LSVLSKHGYGVSGPKTGRLFHADSLRGEKGGLFFTVLGCAVKTAGWFSQILGARGERAGVPG